MTAHHTSPRTVHRPAPTSLHGTGPAGPGTRSRSGLALRIGLALLAGESGVIGVHALFFPAYFYDRFLLGRGWVQMLPPYNEHITRDLGALYLGFFVLLAYTVVRMSRDLVTGSVLAFTAATIPHMVFHALHTDDAPLLLDKVLQVGLLALTAGVGLLLLRLARVHFDAAPSGDEAAGSPRPQPRGR